MNQNLNPSPEVQTERAIQFHVGMGHLLRAIAEFHERFDLPRLEMGEAINRTRLQMLTDRLPMLTEELGEYSKGINHGEYDQAGEELVDLLGVTLGILWTHGPNADRWMQTVCEKYAAKTPETHEITATGKIIPKVTP